MSGTNDGMITAFLLLILAVLVAIVGTLVLSSFSEMSLTHHARVAHAGEAWQASDIAWWMDCHPDDVQHVPTSTGADKFYCQLNADKAIGLVVKAGVIITGFMAAVWYWKRRE